MPLPILPVVTRWGTWLKAAIYYSAHFQTVATVVAALDPEEAAAVETAQRIFTKPQLKAQLAYISQHFSIVAETIEALEKQHLSLQKSLDLVATLRASLEADAVLVRGAAIRDKYEAVLAKNSGFKAISLIRDVLDGISENVTDIGIDFTPQELAEFSFAPITSCDVERSFSLFRNIFSDRRRNFSIENLKFTIVTNAFYSMS